MADRGRPRGARAVRVSDVDRSGHAAWPSRSLDQLGSWDCEHVELARLRLSSPPGRGQAHGAVSLRTRRSTASGDAYPLQLPTHQICAAAWPVARRVARGTEWCLRLAADSECRQGCEYDGRDGERTVEDHERQREDPFRRCFGTNRVRSASQRDQEHRDSDERDHE